MLVERAIEKTVGPVVRPGSDGRDHVQIRVALGSGDPRQDPRIRPLGLDAQARAELLAFLEALTGANIAQLAADARTTVIGDRH